MVQKPGNFATLRWRMGLGALAFGMFIIVIASMTYVVWLPRPLNVILITLDTTRADHLGAYGYQHGLTTGIDDFCEQGVVFERAYAPAPLTLPSHATMLTGLYPPEHGLRVNGQGRLPGNIPLLPEILKTRGYDTAAFVAAFVLDSKFGLERGFDTYDDDFLRAKEADSHGELRREGQDVVSSALSWLRRRASRPFFCWIHLYDAHRPYDLRPQLFGQRFEQLPYDAGVAVEAQQLKRLLTFLRERKLDEKTLVVVAGDHGESFGEHRELEHGLFVYNTTLHVPLVFFCPRESRAGHRIATPVSLVDLTPTVLDILRIPPPRHISGRSLRAALSGGALASRDCYAESEAAFVFNRWCPLQTVISDRWKYIHTTRPELYDLENDPREETNLAQSAIEDIRQMENVLEVMQETFVLATAQNLKLTEKDLASLQALGYVASSQLVRPANPSAAEVLPDTKDMLSFHNKFETARNSLREGKVDETIALAREIIAAIKTLPGPYLLLGECLTKQGHLDEAVTVYRDALEQRPDYVEVHYHLGRIFADQGHLEQAAAEFREVIKQDPDASTAHFNLAQTLTMLKEFDEAILEYQRAIRSDPELVVAQVHLGTLLGLLQRPHDAAPYFESAIRLDPENLVAHSGLSHVLAQMGQIDKALIHAQKAVSLQPTMFEARVNLGVLLAALKRHEEAIRQFRIAQKILPEDPRPIELIRQNENALRNVER